MAHGRIEIKPIEEETDSVCTSEGITDSEEIASLSEHKASPTSLLSPHKARDQVYPEDKSSSQDDTVSRKSSRSGRSARKLKLKKKTTKTKKMVLKSGLA